MQHLSPVCSAMSGGVTRVEVRVGLKIAGKWSCSGFASHFPVLRRASGQRGAGLPSRWGVADGYTAEALRCGAEPSPHFIYGDLMPAGNTGYG